MTTSLVFRKLEPGDSAAYRELRLECLRAHPLTFGSLPEEEGAMATLPFEAAIERASVDASIVGAFEGDRLVGIVGMDRDPRRKTRHRGHIRQVYVKAECRGRKIGESLMRLAIETAFAIDGIEQLELGVVTENSAAISLYSSLGFEPCGVQVNYFKVDGVYRHQQTMQLFKQAAR